LVHSRGGSPRCVKSSSSATDCEEEAADTISACLAQVTGKKAYEQLLERVRVAGGVGGTAEEIPILRNALREDLKVFELLAAVGVDRAVQCQIAQRVEALRRLLGGKEKGQDEQGFDQDGKNVRS
jgi:hypothetical protein